MTRFLSPFRYPGGKSWLVPTLREIVKEHFPNGVDLLCEPFCGGASVTLDALSKGWAKDALMGDIDNQIYNFWHLLFTENKSEKLIFLLEKSQEKPVDNILYDFPHDALQKVLSLSGVPEIDELRLKIAFRTLIKNRTSFTGSLRSDCGKMGSGHSRFNKQSLIKRIKEISSFANEERVTVSGLSSFETLNFAQHTYNGTKVYYLDPPYPTAGPRLYNHHEIDFVKLIVRASRLDGLVILSYENDEQAAALGMSLDFKVLRIQNPKKQTELLFLKPYSDGESYVA